jgi:hypothetical protein
MDYNKNPIVIRNSYLLKRSLVGSFLLFCLCLFAAYRLYFHGIPKAIIENDAVDLRYWQGGLIYIAVNGTIAFFIIANIIRNFLRNPLFIKIYNNHITYDYLTEDDKLKLFDLFVNKSDIKTFTLQKADIKSVKWGFYPFARLDKDDKIWISETTDDKFGTYLFIWVAFLWSAMYQLTYFVINFKIETYVLIRFKGGIMAIPKKEYPSKEKIKFEWRTLFNCQSSGGHYYGD